MTPDERKTLQKEAKVFRKMMEEAGIATNRDYRFVPDGIGFNVIIENPLNTRFIDKPELCSFVSRLLQREVSAAGFGIRKTWWGKRYAFIWIWVKNL